MYKAIGEAATLKPEYRLIQAISEFEAQLSVQQKLIFGKDKQVSPRPEDVMRFTAEIDKGLSARGIRRVYGPRLTNFLDGVQKFAPLGDILMNTTPTMLGSGIWTVVRFSILTAVGSTNQHSTYIDKMSNIFMEAGRSVPRYQNMALLFPESKKLQTYLTEYYIVVVKLCYKILQMSQNSGFMHLWDSLGDPLQEFQSRLKMWSTAIKDEVLIQSVAMTKEEKDDRSRFRAALQKERKEKELRRQQKLRLQVLDKCSTYDHVTTWKQTRKIGNTKLFIADQAYLEWKFSLISSTLVYCGKLGAGKSVLLANIVDDLFLELKPQNSCVAYFFCDHENKESLKASIILRSFTRQVLQLHGILDKLSKLNQDNVGHDDFVSSIGEFLDQGFSKPIYFVLDGLDECEPEQRDCVLTAIKSLQEKFKLLFCISSRLEPDRTSKFQPDQLVTPIFSDIPENNPEIADFIDDEIRTCISSGQLKIQDREIIPAIREVLLLGSQGMFLWVSLSIKALCGLPSDSDILEALANLPPKLSDMYTEILGKSLDSHKAYLNSIMQLMAVAIRPLSMQELRVALNVKPGQMEWNASTLINDVSAVLSSTGGLVIVDEENYTVRFVHYSLRQFLTNSELNNPYCFSQSTAERYMAQVLTTYLNYMCFDTRVSTVLVPKIDGAPIVGNVLSSFGKLGRLMKKSHNGPDVDIGRILTEASFRSKSRQRTDLSLESYTRSFWCQHSASTLDTDVLTQNLVRELMDKDHKFTLDQSYIEDPLAWTAENGFLMAFDLLLEGGLTFANSSILEKLRDAATRGEWESVKMCLKHSSAAPFMDSIRIWSDTRNESLSNELFQLALSSKAFDIVELILQRNDMPQDILRHGEKVISEYAVHGKASKYGDFETVTMLVDSQKFDLDALYHAGHVFFSIESVSTPLHSAVASGQADLVGLLLRSNNVGLNFPDRNGRSLVSVASMKGDIRTLEILLSDKEVKGVRADQPSGNSPFHWAAIYGHKHVISLLLTFTRYSRIEMRNSEGITPLIYAIQNGHVDIARMFLDANKDGLITEMHQPDSMGRIPLSYAAAGGNVEIMKLLIEHFGQFGDYGNLLKPDKRGRSPLSYAAEWGELEPIELLLSLYKYTWDDYDSACLTPWDHFPKTGNPAAESLLVRTMDDTILPNVSLALQRRVGLARQRANLKRPIHVRKALP